MSLKSFFDHWFVKNLLIAIVLFLVAFGAMNLLLGVVTQHNKELEVPDFTNMSVSEASALAQASGMRIDVVDSVYVRRMGRGLVCRQNPKEGSHVKKGRRILLTINSVVPKKVQMPNLVGCSMRQAKAELASRGLLLGKLEYVDDMATNNVIQQLYRGSAVRPGRHIVSGASIDLVVGLNRDDNQTYVPDVVGMKYMRALDVIHENSLNAGRVTFSKNVKDYGDSLDAVVTSQTPGSGEEPVLMGSAISIRLEKK